MNKKLLLTLVSAAVLGLAGCSDKSGVKPKNDDNKNTEPEVEEVPVFVMSGQSNMEGSTNWRLNGKNLLQEYMDDAGEDYSIIENGINDWQSWSLDIFDELISSLKSAIASTDNNW